MDKQKSEVSQISRTSMNLKAFIGIFIFGWLMKMNYDGLGEKGYGWAFIISMAFVFAISRKVEPMFFVVGIVIYVIAWIHSNILLTKIQQEAQDQSLNNSERSSNTINILAKFLDCPNCREELELEENERSAKEFTCPCCNELINLN